ncbi:hypothetical protein FB451DRAFT_1152930 [Mycena latifolia]|nr:hypothetical protein FB451DRAFT_1152930 [Mycena latifolia]
MDDSSGTTAPIRVAELWFDDGNLVIQAESSLFRVTKGILAARSSTFNDLFTIPQPDDCETVDGCPFVRLPDSADDVTAFLKAIFDSSFFEPPPQPTTLSDILGVLRLSHKYDVTYLRRRALMHIETLYPTSLEAYDARFATSTFTVVNSDHLLVARTAAQVDASWIIPCALYEACCCLTVDSICAKASSDTPVDSVERRCLTGLVNHIQAYTARPPFFVHMRQPAVTKGCLKQGRCAQVAADFIAAWEDGKVDVARSDPLRAWKSDLKTCSAWCSHCSDSVCARTTSSRARWWTSMPKIYGLQRWSELLLLRTAALS